MLAPILIGLAVLVILFLIVVAIRPSEFRITRTTRIAAPPSAVFAQVNDFHRWTAWSPWEKLDPELKRTYSGPNSGTGTIYACAGNKQVGEDRMTLTETCPQDLTRIQLEFIKPFAATSLAEFTFRLEGQQTVVTWSMSSRHNFISKAFCMFMNMDKMVGGDFEKGLTPLKSVVETGPLH